MLNMNHVQTLKKVVTFQEFLVNVRKYQISLLKITQKLCLTPSFSLQSHSIHGMTDQESGIRPHREMGILTFEEKKFLLAVERGDVASVKR